MDDFSSGMTIDKLIYDLQKIKNEHGNIPIVSFSGHGCNGKYNMYADPLISLRLFDVKKCPVEQCCKYHSVKTVDEATIKVGFIGRL